RPREALRSQAEIQKVIQLPGGLPDYAGSQTCKSCHGQIYSQWAKSGMAKMLQPYRKENVIGDFTKENDFYAGDTVGFDDGKVRVFQPSDRSLFARMRIRGAQH